MEKVVFTAAIFKLHEKLKEVENNHSISPEARGAEASQVVLDFYDWLDMGNKAHTAKFG